MSILTLQRCIEKKRNILQISSIIWQFGSKNNLRKTILARLTAIIYQKNLKRKSIRERCALLPASVCCLALNDSW